MTYMDPMGSYPPPMNEKRSASLQMEIIVPSYEVSKNKSAVIETISPCPMLLEVVSWFFDKHGGVQQRLKKQNKTSKLLPFCRSVVQFLADGRV